MNRFLDIPQTAPSNDAPPNYHLVPRHGQLANKIDTKLKSMDWMEQGRALICVSTFAKRQVYWYYHMVCSFPADNLSSANTGNA